MTSSSFKVPCTHTVLSRHGAPVWSQQDQIKTFLGGDDPFIYAAPDLFETFWTHQALLIINTIDEKARTERLKPVAQSVYDNVWSSVLSLLLGFFFRAIIPSDENIDEMVYEAFMENRRNDKSFIARFVHVALNWPKGTLEATEADPFAHTNRLRGFFLKRAEIETPRFIRCCFLRARWASRLVFDNIVVHHYDKPPQNRPAAVALKESQFAPTIRKEFLGAVGKRKLYWHLYVDDERSISGKVTPRRYCSPYVAQVAGAFYDNFSEGKVVDSIINNTLRVVTPNCPGSFPLLSLVFPCTLLRGEYHFQSAGWLGPCISGDLSGLVEHVLEILEDGTERKLFEKTIVKQLVIHLQKLNANDMSLITSVLTRLCQTLTYPPVPPSDSEDESDTSSLGVLKVDEEEEGEDMEEEDEPAIDYSYLKVQSSLA